MLRGILHLAVVVQLLPRGGQDRFKYLTCDLLKVEIDCYAEDVSTVFSASRSRITHLDLAREPVGVDL
jgi:hypothetical protein